jgi:hypothetical protein
MREEARWLEALARGSCRAELVRATSLELARGTRSHDRVSARPKLRSEDTRSRIGEAITRWRERVGGG